MGGRQRPPAVFRSEAEKDEARRRHDRLLRVELSGRLSDADDEYLKTLKGRSLKETRDDDRKFFEAHRDDLGQDKPLRAKWERSILGCLIECNDFLVGLLLVLERLFGQVNAVGGPRKLTIRAARKSRSQWLDLNADIGLVFGVRYRGLPALMGKAGYTPAYRTCMATGDAAAGVTSAVMSCTGDELARQDAALKQRYRALMTQLPAGQGAELRAQERVWIRTRDAQCHQQMEEAGGTPGAEVYSKCELDQTVSRVAALANMAR